MRRNPNRREVLGAAIVAAAIPGQGAGGQDSPGPEGQGKVKAGRLEDQLFGRWKREAAEYRIVVRTNPETPAVLRAEPVLSWTNPVRGTYDGLVFVWVVGGRPAAVTCFYRVLREGRFFEAHEFHSLSDAPLVGSLGDQTLWSPPGPGVAAKPVPGAPRPAATAAERLRQMRALAREFRASVDPEQGGKELRLLSQPIFRYESGPDGALFAFVQGTNPEVLLMIEARRQGEGPPSVQTGHLGGARSDTWVTHPLYHGPAPGPGDLTISASPARGRGRTSEGACGPASGAFKSIRPIVSPQ